MINGSLLKGEDDTGLTLTSKHGLDPALTFPHVFGFTEQDSSIMQALAVQS